ncbi:hypothetical protein C7B69_04340 [filamentous cyanobacterium Phorm 46]|nr:hypothetical protein C7B69_04340 [filamentous cyanobacterium Phorm 46]
MQAPHRIICTRCCIKCYRSIKALILIRIKHCAILGAAAMQNFTFSHYSTIKNLPAKLYGTEIMRFEIFALKI